MKKKKLLCLILGIITLYTLSVPSFAYSDSGAQEYADKYANSHNPYYRHFFSDCTNFVSQCIHVGGGIPMGIVNKNPEDYRNWYYQKLAYFPDD